jgi:hypothetical protein
MNYNIWSGLLKAIVKGSVFSLPMILTVLPQEWLNLTVGTLGYLLLDFLQKKYTSL